MTTRRHFLLQSGLTGAAILAGSQSMKAFGLAMQMQQKFVSGRPAEKDRKFISPAVERNILRIKQKIKDPELSWMFENCYPNTLDTTIKSFTQKGKPDTFVITGDIDAMWLRDSTAQVWPYIPLVNEDPQLSALIAGVINRQTYCVLIDPFANAFTFGNQESEHISDKTLMKPGVFERKWEVDSLCYVIRLAHQYWRISASTLPFDEEWKTAMRLIVATFKDQQRKEGQGHYQFRRTTDLPQDTAQGHGAGNPIRPTGMICSVFRPSDDATIFPFLIPSNYFAVLSLRQLSEMVQHIHGDKAFAEECNSLANEVENALHQWAIVNHSHFGKVFAYEVDGYGSALHMDDANVPSLISLPYIAGIDPDDEAYKNTRRMVLSDFNPYFSQGKYSGVGGPHSGENMIWPLSYVMRALTSNNEEEIRWCIRMLKETHAGTGFIHESFYKDDPSHYTRSWFAWANTIFGELIIKLVDEKNLSL